MSDRKSSSRYPYTYACDLIRMKGPTGPHGTMLARADASQVRKLFAEVLGMDDQELAERLADYYLENQDELVDDSVQKITSILHSRAMR